LDRSEIRTLKDTKAPSRVTHLKASLRMHNPTPIVDPTIAIVVQESR
jgi:hypothetical protein